jgi:hypothetical protein
MIQVAFVKENREIDYIISPGTDVLITNRQYYEGLLAVHISSDEDPLEFTMTNIWNFEEEAWEERPRQPSLFHLWDGTHWKFQSSDFWNSLREMRNSKLSKSDWTQIPDAGLSEEKREEWRQYRAALRNIPSTQSNVTMVEGIVWPTPPAT